MALDFPPEIFDESDFPDYGSTVVEPSTSTRAPSPAPSPPPTPPPTPHPAPAPGSPTPDAAPGPAAETPDWDSDKPGESGPAPGDRGPQPENKTADTASAQGDVARNMLLTVPALDQETLPTMPESPGHNLLFDLGMPHLTASPDDMAPTNKRSRDEFEADLFDPDFSLGSQALDIWEPVGESGGVLSRSVSIGREADSGSAASTVPGTGGPEGKDADADDGRGAGSSRARPCKRQRV